MRKDPQILIDDIFESIEMIQEYVKGFDEKHFFADKKTQDAVFKRIENMGEAVKRLPQDFKESHKEIPWKKIAGMRNVLIHEYFGIDVKKVWIVAKSDIPELKEKINLIMKDRAAGRQKRLLK